MAKKIHPIAFRQNVTRKDTIQYHLNKNNYSTEVQKLGNLKSLLEQFYSKRDILVNSICINRDHQNIYLNYTITINSSSRKQDLKSRKRNIKSLPALSSSVKTTRLNREASREPGYIVLLAGSKKQVLLSSELYSLSKLLVEGIDLFPCLIKSNIAQHYNSTYEFSSRRVAQFIRTQITNVSISRQNVNLKSYLDRLGSNLIKLPFIKGVKLQVKGRLSVGGAGGKAGRSKKDSSAFGRVPLQSIQSDVDHSTTIIKTRAGLSSLKLYLLHG